MKRYVVRFTFVGEFEAETDADALGTAAHSVKWGVSTARHMKLEVVAALPIPTASETEQPSIGEAAQDTAEAPTPQSQPSDDFPL